jgi:predicted  nucleic acid-binding Zn-ribbon protein
MKPHKVIWLQYEEPDPDGMADPGDITWCQDKINDSDTKYVLAEDAEMSQLQVKRYAMALDAAEVENKRLTDTINGCYAVQRDQSERIAALEAKLVEERRAVADAHDCRNARYIGLHDTIAELEAENASLKRQMEIGVPDEKLEKRVAELTEALAGLVDAKDRLFDVHCSASTMEELSEMSERTESLWAAARAALKEDT